MATPRAIFTSNRGYTKRSPGNSGYASPILTDTESRYRAYNMAVTEVTEGGPVVVQDGCYAVMFTNTGDTVCRVNNILLYPSGTVLPLTALGDSYTIGGHLQDLYYGTINVAFEAVAALPRLQIVQMFYVGVLRNRDNKL